MIREEYKKPNFYLNKSSICSEPYSNIENYEIALNSEEKYVLHHRYETRDENGELLKIPKSSVQLQIEGLYYSRPAKELIFLTSHEHGVEHGWFDKNRMEFDFEGKRYYSIGEFVKKNRGFKGFDILSKILKNIDQQNELYFNGYKFSNIIRPNKIIM